MLKINIETIPHNEQRYPTVGDWWFRDGIDDGKILEIRVSEMNNWKYEFLVAMHEAIETMLCLDRGISEESVSDFDIQFEKEREQGQHGDEEPGDDPKAPYQKEHFFATNLERQMALELGVDWNTYDNVVVDL